MKGTYVVVAVAALALQFAAPAALAQAGKRYYCGSGENTTTCGPAAAPGIANSCSNAGCHTRNPLNDPQGRVMKAAGSLGAIQGSPDAGMQAIISLYTENELDAIAAWLLSLTQSTPTPPSCSVSANATSPVTGSSITLTASCTNAPTSWSWTNCSSNSSTCTATQATAGSRTYTVTATNAAGDGSASVTVTWSATGTTPPPPPPPPSTPTRPEPPRPYKKLFDFL
jgi:hypothetical protein